MSAKILSFNIQKTDPKRDPELPNETCYYSDYELHEILQDLIDCGHKHFVENTLIACRHYWDSKANDPENC